MSRFHNINGEQIEFTPEEEIARDVEEKEWEDSAFDRAIVVFRLERNALLASTDWRDLPSYAGTKQAEWKTYRQALRDLPSTQTAVMNDFGGITGVTYPTKPS